MIYSGCRSIACSRCQDRRPHGRGGDGEWGPRVRGTPRGEARGARLLLGWPVATRGGEGFAIGSFPPGTTIGGGAVLDPSPPQRPGVSERGLVTSQPPAE